MAMCTPRFLSLQRHSTASLRSVSVALRYLSSSRVPKPCIDDVFNGDTEVVVDLQGGQVMLSVAVACHIVPGSHRLAGLAQYPGASAPTTRVRSESGTKTEGSTGLPSAPVQRASASTPRPRRLRLKLG